MTNFFGIRSDEKAQGAAGFNEPFITASVSPALDAEMTRQIQDENRLIKSIRLPRPLQALKSFAWLWIIVLLAALLSACLKVGFARAYAHGRYFFWALAVLIPLWLILFLYEKSRRRNAEETGDVDRVQKNADSLTEAARQELGIPGDAPKIDVLAQKYALKRGEYISKETSLHFNMDLFLFLRDGKLCLADLRSVWSIPLSALGNAALSKKYIPFANWNKDEGPRSDAYKPYKIRTNNYGWIFARCWRVDIHDEKGDFFLLIPEYEEDAFFRLTGLRPAAAEQ